MSFSNVGSMFYSIYLFHFIIIHWVKLTTTQLHLGENFLIYYVLQSAFINAGVLLFCGAFSLLIEHPCMDSEWPAQLWRRLQTLFSSAERQSQSAAVTSESLPASAKVRMS